MMTVVMVAGVALLLGADVAQAADAKELLHRYACYTCHADDEPGAGPPFADIARQYRSDPDAARKLQGVIRKGHAGWPWHMPPSTEVSPAEARAMVQYILSVKPSTSAGDGAGLRATKAP